jgi:hypothetical protein
VTVTSRRLLALRPSFLKSKNVDGDTVATRVGMREPVGGSVAMILTATETSEEGAFCGRSSKDALCWNCTVAVAGDTTRPGDADTRTP